jgi:hypothetical protein
MTTPGDLIIRTLAGSLVIGTEHGPLEPDVLPMIDNAVQAAFDNEDKGVTFLAEGTTNGYEGSEQEAVARHLYLKFGLEVEQDTWDDETVRVFDWDPDARINRFYAKSEAVKTLIESYKDGALVEAALYAMLVGQGDKESISARATMKLRELGVDPNAWQQLYRASFPEDFGDPTNPLSTIQAAYNRLRRANLVRKIRSIEARGGIAIAVPGASHIAQLRPILEKSA